MLFCFLSFLWIINKKWKVNHVTTSVNHPKLIYIGPNKIFSPNLIIIMGIFRNTSNPFKLFVKSLFPIGSSAYQIMIPFTKVLSRHYADDTWTSNACHGLNFHLSLQRPEIFSCSQYHKYSTLLERTWVPYSNFY